jgi:hypothetical protein
MLSLLLRWCQELGFMIGQRNRVVKWQRENS